MHFVSPSDPSQTAAAEAKPRYVYSILNPHGQSSITSPESVPCSCVRQHTQDVPAKWRYTPLNSVHPWIIDAIKENRDDSVPLNSGRILEKPDTAMTPLLDGFPATEKN